MDLNHARLPIPPRGLSDFSASTERDAHYNGLLEFVKSLAETVKKKHHVAVIG